jgi:hypothetical protein
MSLKPEFDSNARLSVYRTGVTRKCRRSEGRALHVVFPLICGSGMLLNKTTGQYEKALVEARKAIELDPDLPSGITILPSTTLISIAWEKPRTPSGARPDADWKSMSLSCWSMTSPSLEVTRLECNGRPLGLGEGPQGRVGSPTKRPLPWLTRAACNWLGACHAARSIRRSKRRNGRGRVCGKLERQSGRHVSGTLLKQGRGRWPHSSFQRIAR